MSINKQICKELETLSWSLLSTTYFPPSKCLLSEWLTMVQKLFLNVLIPAFSKTLKGSATIAHHWENGGVAFPLERRWKQEIILCAPKELKNIAKSCETERCSHVQKWVKQQD